MEGIVLVFSQSTVYLCVMRVSGRENIIKNVEGKYIKMKKFLAIVLCVCLMATCLVACGEKEADYKLGMGVVVSTDSSSSETHNAQVDATVATVVTDKDGKIVSCRIDVAQSKMDVTDGAVDTAKTFKSKMELGDEYGMAGKVDNDGNGTMLEWYEQAHAFEEYVVGKTAADVTGMPTKEANGHIISDDQALLDAGCSMQVTDFVAAVAAACNDEQAMSFKSKGGFTLGVAATTTAGDSKAATADEDGLVAMYTDFAATVVADGKIVAALNDSIQPKITINAAGEIMDAAFKATKRNLKEEYGMEGKVDNDGNGTMLEWYKQSEAFSKFVAGKTADEVADLPTQEVNDHVISADQGLLDAGCSMQVTSMQKTTAHAAKNAH